MTRGSSSLPSARVTPALLKFASIAILGISAGLCSALYSPLLAFIGVSVFTGTVLIVYVSSTYHSGKILETTNLSLTPTSSKMGLLFYLLYTAFFLSITIPKSGKTVGGIPVTTANLLILFTLICWLISLLFARHSIFDVPLAKMLSGFMLCGIGSTIIGLINRNPRKAVILDFVAFIGFIVLYFLIAHTVRTERHIRWVVWMIVFSTLLVCVYGILQTRFGFARVAIPGITEQQGKVMYQGVGRWNVIEGGREKVYSTFQNGNIFGNHLATFIPFLGGILLGVPNSKKKLLSVGVFLLAAYVLILTYSRGAFAGTISGMLALAFIAKKIRLKAVLIILLLAAIFLGFLYRYADRPELTRYDIRRFVAEPDRFSAGRLERAKEVLRGYAQLPINDQLFGIGFGGVLVSPLGWRFEYVDNLYLTLLFKMGMIGLGLLGVVFLQLFIVLFRLRARSPNLYFQGLINGGIAGLLASLIHNLADTLWFFPPLSANFWFLAGLTMAIALVGSRESAMQPEAAASKPAVHAHAASRAPETIRVHPSPTI